jgi:tetratricopeptide (TPR) repeat protein
MVGLFMNSTKKFLGICVALALFIGITTQVFGQNTAQFVVSFMQEQDYSKALEALKQIPEEKRTLKDWENLAYCYQMAGQFPHAESLWIHVLALDSLSSAALYHLGQIAVAEGDYEKAVHWQIRLIQLKPDNPFYQKQIAQTFEAMELDSMAWPYYQKAVMLNSNDLESIYRLGKISFRARDFAQADYWVSQGLALHPGHSRLRLLELETCYSDAYYAHTLELLSTYLETHPYTNYIRRIHYIALIQEQRYEEALAVIQSLEEPDNNKENTYFYRYKAYFGLRDLTHARLWLERTIAEGRNKQEATYYGLLGNLLIDMEFYPQAARQYIRALEQNGDVQLYYWIARSYDAAQRYDDAHMYYRTYLRECPENDRQKYHEHLTFAADREKVLENWKRGK